MKFDFKQYLTRVFKYFIYLSIIFVLIVAIFSFTSKSEFKFSVLFREGTEIQILIFLVVMSLIYPFFGYAKRKVYLNGSFSDDREKILDILKKSNFILECEMESKIKFRHKSIVVRAFRMFEDRIKIDYSDNPITIEGQRKEAYRLARMIEYATREE